MIYFLWMNNQNKRLFIPISVSLILVYSLAMINGWGFVSDGVLLTAALFFAYLYTIRFYFKNQKSWMAFFKWVIVMLWLFSSFIIIDLKDKNDKRTFWAMVHGVLILIMYLVYVIELISLDQKVKEIMKKWVALLFIIQMIICIGCLIFFDYSEDRSGSSKNGINQTD
jgi:hypothetical protein